MPRPVDVDELVQGVVAGSRAHVARAITLVESRLPLHRQQTRELLNALPSEGSDASIRVGISGVPGAGKSTFIDAMGVRLISQGHRVAVLAVDPSSSRTGGSVLGDRTRMGELSNLEAAFVRPSPTGRHLGGVARATRETMLVCEAAGYDVVVVETVGVGQSEVAVSGMVDTFLLLALARSGDQLQGIKRGILELADVIAVNKADGENAGEARVTARELSIAMKLISQDPTGRRAPVLTCSARDRTGLDEVWNAVLEHREWLESHGGLAAHRARQQVEWMWSQVEDTITESLRSTHELRALGRRLTAEVADQELSALDGANAMLMAYAHAVPSFGWDV